MPLTFHDLRSGYIALWAGFINEEDLAKALDRQRNVGDDDPLQWSMAELLLRRHKITKYELAVLDHLAPRVPAETFVQQCLERGYVDDGTLAACRRTAQAAGGGATEVVDILVRDGLVMEEQAAEIMKPICESDIAQAVGGPRSLEVLWQIRDSESHQIETHVPGERADAEEQPPKFKPRDLALVGAAAAVVLGAAVFMATRSQTATSTYQDAGTARISLSDEPGELIRCLGHGHARVRSEALRRLVKTKQNVAPALAEALANGGPRTLRGAMHALGLIRDPAAVPALERQLQSGDWTVRFQAVDALGKIGGKEAYAAIATVLQGSADTNERVRSLAASFLGESGDAAYVSLLRQLANDEDRETAQHAAAAARRLTGQSGGDH